MPRPPRQFPPDLALHIINRGNDRRRLFTRAGDYARFLVLIRRAARRYPVDLLAYVLMPNHWHLVMWPAQAEDISRFLQWLTGTHASRLRRLSNTVGEGHVYQGRYHAFPIESAEHLLRTMRYVEANPLRAALVDRAEDWPWSSLADRRGQVRLISPAPTDLPPLADWLTLVNAPVMPALRPDLHGTPRKK